MRKLSLLGSERFVQILLAVLFLVATFSSPGCKSNLQTQRKSIMWAAMMGDLELLKDLEKEGQSINIQDPRVFEWSPLIAAIYHDHPDVVSYLISRGAKLDLQDRQGETALMWAITTGDTNTVRLLLASGATVEVKNTSGVGALGYAEGSEYRETLVDLLNRYKATSR